MPLIDPNPQVSPQTALCSVIIPVYNGLEYTRKCIDTLLSDDGSAGFEIIVVDNASSDGVEIYLAALRDRLTLLTQQDNIGFARANNLAAQRAKGRYLVFLNNDTVPEPGWLDALVGTAESDSDVAVVGSKLLFPLSRLVQHAGVVFNTNARPGHIYENFPEDHPAVEKERDFQAVTAACMLVRADRFRELGGFDTRFINGFEDVDFCLRVRERGWRVVYQPRSVLLHHAGRSVGRKGQEEQNARRLYAKWRGKIQSDHRSFYGDDGYKVIVDDSRVRFSPDGVDAGAILNQARAEYKDGHFAKAYGLFREFYYLIPYSVTALNYMALIHERRGELEEAATMLLRISALKPGADNLLRLADNAYKRRNYDLASQFLEGLVNSDVSDGFLKVEAYAMLGDIKFKCGDVEGAGQHYSSARQLDPTCVRACVGMGTVKLTKQDNRNALQDFQAALEQNPCHPKAVLGMGLCRLTFGERDAARELLMQAALLDPANPQALAALLPLLHERGELDRADELLDRYLKLFPDDPPMLLARAGIAFARGDLRLSRELLNALLAQEPENDASRELNIELKKAEIRLKPQPVAVPA